jgi:hypothetical protein
MHIYHVTSAGGGDPPRGAHPERHRGENRHQARDEAPEAALAEHPHCMARRQSLRSRRGHGMGGGQRRRLYFRPRRQFDARCPGGRDRSISSRPTVTSLLAIVSISRCAKITACAAARSVGSGSEGVITREIQPDSSQKIARVPPRESIRHASPGRLWPPGFLGHPPIDSGQKIRELCGADRHNTVRHRRPQKTPALKPLGEQACALDVVPNNFYQITTARFIMPPFVRVRAVG